jgi:hypothetical protein
MHTDALCFIIAGMVKGVAVSSQWVPNLQEAARKKLGTDDDTGKYIIRKGIAFDEKLVFMLVLPIRFSNLKASDVTNVSKVCSYHVDNRCHFGLINRPFR